MGKETIYVVGHRNPDTDSVCSAMAYACLRRLQGLEEVQAARAGTINRQTEFVLEELALPVPPLLVDVFPRVRHVVSGHVVTLPVEAPLSRAMELFHLHHVRLLPVVDDDRRPLGIVYLKRLAEKFLVPRVEAEIRKVLASAESIRECLRAVPVHRADGDAVEELHLYIGAMASATFHQKIAGLDPRRMILITGDRQNIQEEAVERGVRVLVVTGNMPFAPQVVARAREKGVTLLSTPFDTATSAWLTRLSTPVRCLMQTGFSTAGLDDRLDDLRLKLVHGAEPGVLILDADGRMAAVATKSTLLAPSPIKLILVDHNELSQAVAGAEKVEILEIIDHHRLGNQPSEMPIRFINQPLGSTCTVVATLFRQAGIDPDRATAGLMLAGLLSDTVILKSPTTTGTDREIARWLGSLSGLDPGEFGRRMFGAGSTLTAFPTPRHLILSDFKEYQAGERRFGVGQVEVVSFHEFLGMKETLADALAAIREEKRLDMVGLLVTDIVQETSLLLALGSRDLPYLIGYPRSDEGLYELKGVLSRKKQLVPHLLKVMRS